MLIRIGEKHFEIDEVFPNCVIAKRKVWNDIQKTECFEYKLFNKEGKEEEISFSEMPGYGEIYENMVVFHSYSHSDAVKYAIFLTSIAKFLSNKDGEKIFKNYQIQGDKIKIQWNDEVTEWYDFFGTLIVGINHKRLYDKDNKTIAIAEEISYSPEVVGSEKNIVGISFVLSGERVFYWF